MEPALEFVFQVKVRFASRNQGGMLPSGVRRWYTLAAAGEIKGPRLQGRAVPDSGADLAGWGLMAAPTVPAGAPTGSSGSTPSTVLKLPMAR